VILQRINLGLFAVLGELSATADWRRVAEEIWPFTQAPPATPMGVAEAAWNAHAGASRRSRSSSAGGTGRLAVIVVPWPGADRTSSRPPSAASRSAMFRWPAPSSVRAVS
jgi:hypothetical protein